MVEYDPLEPTSSQSRTLHRLYVRSELGHGFEKSLDRYKTWLEAGFRENRCAAMLPDCHQPITYKEAPLEIHVFDRDY